MSEGGTQKLPTILVGYMDVDARLEAGHGAEKNVILVLGSLLPALVGSINSFPDFFCSFAGETGVALRVDTEIDEITVDTTVRLTKVNGGGVVRPPGGQAETSVGRYRGVDDVGSRIRGAV